MSHSDGQRAAYDSRAARRGHGKASVKAVRPKFDRPPLVEQAITVVFDALAGFSIGDFGLFWAAIRDEFPTCEQAPPLVAPIERLGEFPIQQDVKLVFGETLPRCLYRNPDSGEAVQIQDNRFTFNWAKMGDTPYPHSERTVERFVELFERFQAYVADRGLELPAIIQCEITNVNIIPVSDFGASFEDAPRAFQLPTFASEGGFLNTEAYVLSVQHLITIERVAKGRLHVNHQPVVNSLDQSQAIKLELTARSGRGSADLAETLAFFDIARSAINAAFLAHTMREMWTKWGLKNG